MKTLYKYIICFLLGLISYYLLFSDAEELIEGHKCFSKDTINNFSNGGAYNVTPTDNLYAGKECENTIDQYNQMCFHNDDDGDQVPDSIPKISSLDDCEKTCNNKYTKLGEEVFQCGGYSFVGGRCCIYKKEYIESLPTDFDENNIYKRPDITELNECIEITNNSDQNNIEYKILLEPCKCGNNPGKTCSTFQYCLDNDTCGSLESIKDENELKGKLDNCIDISDIYCYAIKTSSDCNSKTNNNNKIVCEWENDVCKYKTPEYGNVGKIKNFCKHNDNIICHGEDVYYDSNEEGCVHISTDVNECPYKNVIHDPPCTENENCNRDSDILEEECYCNDEHTTSCKAGGYCSLSENHRINVEDEDKVKGICVQTIPECISNDNFLTESCKGDDGTLCQYQNERSEMNIIYNDNFDPKCKEIQACEMGKIISENGHCFCSSPSVHEESLEPRLCLPGSICNTSGCGQYKICSEGYTLDDSKCVPPNCDFYSETNNTSIESDCICTSEERSESHVCIPGNYCFDDDSGRPGCKKLPEECQDDTLLNTPCICPHETKNPQPYVCGKDYYCSETDGCYKTDCDEEGKIINPNNHKECIDEDHDKGLIERFIDEIKKNIQIILNLKKI